MPASYFVAPLRVRGQNRAGNAEVSQPRGADVAGIAHVRNQPGPFLGVVMRTSFELFNIYLSLPALIDHPFVCFGPGYERGIVSLSVRQQDKERLVRRLLNLFFLIDFQAVRPAGEIHHSYREQIGMVRHVHVRFEYLYALYPEFVLNHIADIDVGEFVLQEQLRDIMQAPYLREHAAGI